MECVATCRPGLEGVLAEEIRELGGTSVEAAKRAVNFRAGQAELYRLNMGLRSAIQILVPLRTFTARDYDRLYYQARRTNWHQLFRRSSTIRIDVNGRSPGMTNSQYVIHRVKDAIVDTFRKLEGERPSISKGDPDIHIVVHLQGDRVTLCLDSSGIPLFKRGYRVEHGPAPIKEDLAAGMLLLGEAGAAAGLVDPMCGSGTFLFEGWMLMARRAPNLDRGFAFEHWLDYDPEVHAAQRVYLREREVGCDKPVLGWDKDAAVIEQARSIKEAFFAEADIRFTAEPLQQMAVDCAGGLMVANPPYGERMGREEDLGLLYRELGEGSKRVARGGRLL
ncbi:MAG: ribosomal large subunit methyltransferase, partial [Verrucomicrobiota bacterium]